MLKNTSADEVLICLNEFYEKNHLERHKHGDIRQALAVKYGRPPSDLVMILEYLWRTGMVDKDDNDKYIIKYEGKVFIEDGGYAGRQDSALMASRKEERDNVYAARTSLFVALGTIGLVLVEIIRLLIEHPPHFCFCQ